MKKRLIIGSLISLLAMSSIFASIIRNTRSGSPDELEEVRRVIDKGNAMWIDGWFKGDAEMVSSLFADDGVQLAGNGKMFKGRKEIAEHLKAAMQGVDPGVKVTVITTKVWLDGDVAYETGKYKYEYTKKGTAGADEGRYVTIWKRQKDGSWKLSMDMGVPAS
jgi:uncharacterized protein (TIGR02246 family)